MPLPIFRRLPFPTRRALSSRLYTPPATVAIARRRWLGTPSHVTPEAEEDDYDFGSYRVILPEEPFVFGTSHIPRRTVPPHIQRPPYITGRKLTPEESNFRGKIQLGGEQERGVREAAALAKKVREYAGSLVQVSLRF